MCNRILSALAGLYPGDAKKYKFIILIYGIIPFVIVFSKGEVSTILAKTYFIVMFFFIPINIKIYLNENPTPFKKKLLCYSHIFLIFLIFKIVMII